MYLSTSFLYLFESKLHPLCISVQRFVVHKLFIFYCIFTHFDIMQGLLIHCCIEYKPFFRLHIQASLAFVNYFFCIFMILLQTCLCTCVV